MDPALISKKLGLQPSQAHAHGQPRFTPKGTRLAGTYDRTRWSIFFENTDGKSIDDLIDEAVKSLPETNDFWSELIQAGGRAQLILSVVGTKYQGAAIDGATLAKLAQMGVWLGLEVYAVPQNG